MPPFSLRKVPLFNCLGEPEFEKISQLTVAQTYPKGSMIILAEDFGDTLFIIRKGQVKISVFHEDGREVIFSLLGPGKVFGELSLLDGKPRSANAVALKDSEVLTLRRADFLQLIIENPRVAALLLAELASRLRRTDEKIEGLALLDVTSRISQTLLQLAEDHGIEAAEGVLIESRPTHQQLANMSGTTRETVSRVMNRLEAQGYLTCKGRQILILREEK